MRKVSQQCAFRQDTPLNSWTEGWTWNFDVQQTCPFKSAPLIFKKFTFSVPFRNLWRVVPHLCKRALVPPGQSPASIPDTWSQSSLLVPWLPQGYSGTFSAPEKLLIKFTLLSDFQYKSSALWCLSRLSKFNTLPAGQAIHSSLFKPSNRLKQGNRTQPKDHIL